MKIFIWFALALLLGLSVWAQSHISIFEEMRNAPLMYWGTQALVDLYIGFTMVSVLYFKFAPNRVQAICWMLATFVFGNIASLIFLLLHFEKINIFFKRAEN